MLKNKNHCKPFNFFSTVLNLWYKNSWKEIKRVFMIFIFQHFCLHWLKMGKNQKITTTKISYWILHSSRLEQPQQFFEVLYWSKYHVCSVPKMGSLPSPFLPDLHNRTAGWVIVGFVFSLPFFSPLYFNGSIEDLCELLELVQLSNSIE